MRIGIARPNKPRDTLGGEKRAEFSEAGCLCAGLRDPFSGVADSQEEFPSSQTLLLPGEKGLKGRFPSGEG